MIRQDSPAIREKIFGTEGSIDIVKGAWQPREKRGLVQLEVPDGRQGFYLHGAGRVR